MTRQTINLTETVYDYLIATSIRETPALRHLRRETAELSHTNMQISPEQGQLMALLVKLLNAKNAIEVGTYTGYSSLVVAQALAKDGCLITCDVDENTTTIAQRFWEQAGVAHKIDLRLAPAIDTLKQLLVDGGKDYFDFGFIDADKENYIAYYDLILELLRPGGLVVIDNVLWNGRVADQNNQTQSTQAIRDLNKKIHSDDRVDISMLPISDGLTLACKK